MRNSLGTWFNADVRNCGGRSQLQQHIQNHRTKLLKVKPAVVIKAPRAHIDNISPSKRNSKRQVAVYSIAGSPRTSYIGVKKGPEFSQVQATYRTISTLQKGIIDSNAPKAYLIARRKSATRRESPYNMETHLQNMKSLQKRMERIYKGHMDDRKKNHSDCVAYPSLFFRKQGDPLADNYLAMTSRSEVWI